VRIEGNGSYILKFAYMANHLQLALTGKLPIEEPQAADLRCEETRTT
jgi:hypothetical protein